MESAGRRFSYSNVMSTLAVFLALGGSAYAVSQINGKRLKNHSVAGTKLKDSTITGRQVRESTLGKVPHARHAGRAHTAVKALRATTANLAHSAGNAQVAATANNSLALGGLAPAAFERSTTVLYGSGRVDATNPQPLFSSSVGDFDLTTDGGGDKFTQLRIKNNGSGNLIGTVFTQSGPPTAFGIAGGRTGQIGPATGNGVDYLDTLVTVGGSPKKSVWVHCLFNPSSGDLTAFCWGLQAGAP
jgi:hypothetical protein